MSKKEDIEKLKKAIDNPNTPDNLKATFKTKLKELEAPAPAKKKSAAKKDTKEKRKPKFKKGEFIGRPRAKEFGKIIKVDWNATFEEFHYLVHYESNNLKVVISESDNPIKKSVKQVKKPAAKKDDEYDCDELIEQSKEAAEKRKKYQEKRDKKTESTKNKERLDKTSDIIEESFDIRLEKGKALNKSEVEALIKKTTKLLTHLKTIFKSL